MSPTITRNRVFGAIAILTGVAFALMGLLDAPGLAFAITAVVVGALFVLLGMFWPDTTDKSDTV